MKPLLFLSRADVQSLVTIDDCIAAVEAAFAAPASRAYTAAASVHLGDGAFKIKAAALSSWFAAKVNGNFFGNPARGLPRIQGLIVLMDATSGTPLAVLDSIGITILRTGAATAVAARHLARPDAATLLICGCGEQGRVSAEAVRRVRNITTTILYDVDRNRAEALAEEIGAVVAGDLRSAAGAADICVLCTPSRSAYFTRDLLRPGLLVAAIGADSADKQEVHPEAMAAATVVVDDLDQCAAVGDLRGALASKAMTRADVAATLGEVIRAGHAATGRPVIFDSTGIGLQDVAAAALVYQRAVERQ